MADHESESEAECAEIARVCRLQRSRHSEASISVSVHFVASLHEHCSEMVDGTKNIHHHHHHHQSLNREGRWGTTYDFTTSFLHFSLFSTALWDLPNSRPVHCLMLSSHLFLCPPCLFPLSLSLARWFWPDLMNGRHDHTTAVCVSLQWSGGLCVVRLPALSWHRFPCW